jgi:hypothetical protein
MTAAQLKSLPSGRREADRDRHAMGGRGLEQPGRRRSAPDEGGEREEEVARGVAGQAQLGEDEELRALGPRRLDETQDLLGIPRGVGHPDTGAGGADTQEAMGCGAHEDRIPAARRLRESSGLLGNGAPWASARPGRRACSEHGKPR